MFAGQYYNHRERFEEIKEEQVNIREMKKWLNLDNKMALFTQKSDF